MQILRLSSSKINHLLLVIEKKQMIEKVTFDLPPEGSE